MSAPMISEACGRAADTVVQEGKRTGSPELSLDPRVLEALEPEFLLHLAFPEPPRVVLFALEQEATARVLQGRQVVLDVLADHALERRVVDATFAVCAAKVLLVRRARAAPGCVLEGVGSVGDRGGPGQRRFVPPSGSGRRSRVGGDQSQRPFPVRIGRLLLLLLLDMLTL